MRDRRLGHYKGAFDIRFNDYIPILVRDFPKLNILFVIILSDAGETHTRIIYQDMQSAEVFYGFVYCGPAAISRSHVTADREDSVF